MSAGIENNATRETRAFCDAEIEHPLSESEKWGYGETHPCLRYATRFYPAGKFCELHDPRRSA